MNNHDEQARRIARLLDESTSLTAEQQARLADARRLALSRYASRTAPQPALAGVIGNWTERPFFGVRYVIPIAALVLGLMGVTYVHTVSTDIADIDAGLLTDELPLNAYLDTGFDSWLKSSSR